MTAELGRVVRLQVQRRPIKSGDRGAREYRPEVIESVRALELTPAGAVGIGPDAERIVDVHHTEHPKTRNTRGRSGLSVMSTGDYAWLRARFGDHLTNGIAGESVLINGPPLAGRSFADGLIALTAAGPVPITEVVVADPCVEFTRFCLQRPADSGVDDAVKGGLVELGGGRRGYRGVPGAGLLILGDRIALPA